MSRWASGLASAATAACIIAGNSGCGHRPTRGHAAESQETIDLAQALDARRLRIGRRPWLQQFLFTDSRSITKLRERNGVHLPGGDGFTLGWIEGTDFTAGTIEVDVRGKDCHVCSFVGIAFHRRDDSTYEAVYLRPYNFRATDPVGKHQGAQYIKMPEHDEDRLRTDFATSKWESVASPVTSVGPTDWVRLRVVVDGDRVLVHVGSTELATLDARKLGQLDRGQVGLWAGSDGDFANLVITPSR